MLDEVLAWLRLGVVVLLVLAVGGVATVIRLHWRAWRVLSANPATHAAGLTPLHVWLVSSGVLISEVALAWGLLESLRTAATVSLMIRTVMYGVGAGCIIAALVVVGGLQRRRLRFGRGCTRVVIAAEAERVAVEVEDPIVETRD